MHLKKHMGRAAFPKCVSPLNLLVDFLDHLLAPRGKREVSSGT